MEAHRRYMNEQDAADRFRSQQSRAKDGKAAFIFRIDLAAMDFYSDFADAVRDLLVEAASHHQGHHLTLAAVKVSKRARSAALAFSLSSHARSRARPS
jgi:hypothetical protein